MGSNYLRGHPSPPPHPDLLHCMLCTRLIAAMLWTGRRTAGIITTGANILVSTDDGAVAWFAAYLCVHLGEAE